MQRTSLPHDLASLVHHVELSKAGWRERAIGHLLLTTIEKYRNGVAADDVYISANMNLPGPLASDEMGRQIDSLKSKGRIIQLPNGNLKLTEQARSELEKQLKNAKVRSIEVRREFETAFADLPPRIEISWEDFITSFLTPLVSELGAKTYQILTGQEPGIEDTTSYPEFLKRFPDEDRVLVCQSIATFVESTSPAVRQYVLRLLNIAFLVRALTLPAGAVQELLRRTRRRLQMRVFVDTNFLFSLLGLDVNPADDVVHALHELIDRMPSRVDVKLYMLPSTVDEARETIARYEDRLSSFYLTRPIAEAIHQGKIGLSGISATYVQEAYSDGKRVSAKDYFAPYLKDFIGVARSKGVELFNASLDELRMDQAVIDDVTGQMEWEKSRPQNRAKSYETLLHDMVLWHFTRRQRPERVDSPLDVRSWIATIDYRFLGFDAFKRRGRPQEPPVCLHPTVLLQILQFWVPNSESLEAALMTSLRPVPPRFDSDSEGVTVKIISALSRFEAIDDLSVDTVTSVVLSDAVRERIGSAKNSREELEVVRTGVMMENRRLKMRAERYRKDAKGLSKTVEERDIAISTLEEKIHVTQLELDAVGATLKAEKASKGELKKQLIKARDDLTTISGEVRTGKVVRGAHRAALLWGLGVAGSLLGISGFTIYVFWESITSIPVLTSVMAIGVIFAVGLGTEIAYRILIRIDMNDTSLVPTWLGKCKNWCWGVLTALVITALAAGLFG